ELGQLLCGRGPRAGARERPDVQLVDDLAFERHAAPRRVGPAKTRRVDDHRWTVGTFRLVTRRRIGIELLIAIDPELVQRARWCGCFAAEVSGVRRFRLQDGRRVPVDDDSDPRHAWRPDTEMHAAVAE